MNDLPLYRTAVAIMIGLLVILAGCVVPDGEYGAVGYNGMPGYYEPYGIAYGGWAPGYYVAPPYRYHQGGYHAASHATSMHSSSSHFQH